MTPASTHSSSVASPRVGRSRGRCQPRHLGLAGVLLGFPLLGTGCAPPPVDEVFYNASFEVTYPETEIPMQWYSGSEFGLHFSADTSRHTRGQRSLRVRSTQPMQRWGAMSFLRMMDFTFDGPIHTIGIAMDILSEGVVDGYFSPFTWKQASSGEIVVKNLASDSLNGTTEWVRYFVADTVGPEIDPNKVFAGIQLNGEGQVWVDNVELFINGEVVGDTPYVPDLPSDEDVAFVQRHSVPLRHLDPHASLDDLRVLDSRLAGARIVGLGEATHGTSEIFTMKHRVLRYLVEHHDFRVLFLEGHVGASYRINEYIHTGLGDPAALVGGIGFWTWSTEEVLALVEWMRRYNEGAPPDRRLSFVGVDVQGVVEEIDLLDGLSRALPDLNASLVDALSPIRSMGVRLRDGEFVEGLTDSLPAAASVAGRARAAVEAARAQIVRATDERTYHWMYYLSRSVENYVDFFNVMYNRAPGDPFYTNRDSLMAENLRYAREHLTPGKAAYWAHNHHVANAVDRDLGKMVGWYLKQEHGDAYRAIGFSFGRGTYRAIDGRQGSLSATNFAYPPFPGCLEYLLGRSGTPPLFFDLQASEAADPSFYRGRRFRLRHVGAVAIDNQFSVHPVHEHYDHLIYLGETSAAKALGE